MRCCAPPERSGSPRPPSDTARTSSSDDVTGLTGCPSPRKEENDAEVPAVRVEPRGRSDAPGRRGPGDVRRRRPVQRGGPGRGGVGVRRRPAPRQHRHRRGRPRRRRRDHRRSLRRVQGADGRLLGARGARPRRGHRPGPARLGRLPRQGRGPSLPGRRLTRRVPTPAPGDDPAPLANPSTDTTVDQVFREEYGRVVAALVRRFGDIELAEDVAQEAFVEAVSRWPRSGLPPNPGAWLTTTAKNRAIDRLRRESTRDARHAQAAAMLGPFDDDDDDDVDPDTVSSVPDERLRLIFTCCHPALARDAQVALTLRLLGGLTMAEIARAFLVDEAAMSKRLTRSKQKIKAAHIPYRIPPDHELPSRLAGVLATLYLVFNEGYLPSSPDVEVRTDLSAEAIRQARVLASLMPDEPEVLGLLALMLLTEARRPARFADGVLVTLPEQDRTRWDARLVAEGHDLVRACLRRGHRLGTDRRALRPAVRGDADTRRRAQPGRGAGRARRTHGRPRGARGRPRARRLPRIPGRPGRPAAAGRPGRGGVPG